MSFPADQHLRIGGLIYPHLDQCDFTGPFEVLVRVPNSKFHIIWKDKHPLKDFNGLTLVADTALHEAPQLDVLLVPGGFGQEALMHDEELLGFIRSQYEKGAYVFSVCTGALLLGAAGLLHGKRATTHWLAVDSLPHFGATVLPHERVVVDGKIITAAGVTAGIDGAFTMVNVLRGKVVAEEIQLYIQYDPQPPFNAGSPDKAPPAIVEKLREESKANAEKRKATAKAYQERYNKK